MTTRTFTPQEYADQLKVCVKTIYRLIRRGSLKAERIGRQYRIIRTVQGTSQDTRAIH